MELDLSQAKLATNQAPVVEAPEVQPEVQSEVMQDQPSLDAGQNSGSVQDFGWIAEDDFAKSLLDHYKKGGDIEEYISIAKTDYDAMDPLTLHKQSLKANYCDLPADMFEEYFNQYIQKQYGVSPEELGEDDSLAKRLIGKDAEAIREKLKESQAQFKQSGTFAYEKQLKEWQDSVMQLDPVKEFQDQKIIKVKVGDDVINFEVNDPEQSMDITLNNDKFWGLFADERGQTNWQKWFEVLQFAQNTDSYKRAILNTGKTKGTQKLLDELENPSTNTTSKSSNVDPFSSAEAFLKSAKIKR